MPDIVDCSNPDCLQSPIDVTPDGVQLTGTPPWAVFVWTSTSTLGVFMPPPVYPSYDACDNWTLGTGEASSVGYVGESDLLGESPIDGGWTNMGALISACQAPNRLYCFQQ